MSPPSAGTLVGVAVVFAFGGALLWIAGHDVKASDLALVMFGMLASKFGTIVDFYFGSSAPSHAKDATIDALVHKETP